MTRKQRIFAALRGEPVSPVPFATYNLQPYADSPHRRDPSYRDLLALVEQKAGMYCKRSLSPASGVSHAAGDASQPPASQPAGSSVERVEEDGGRTVVTTILPTPRGDLRCVRVKPRDQPAMVTEHFIKTDADIDRYMSLPWEPPQYDAAPLRAFAEELGERGVIAVTYSDPMYAAASLFDFGEYCVRYATRPGTIRRLMDHLFAQIAEDTRRKARACQQLDVIFLTGGPEVATPPMMPPQAFAQLVVPYQRKLIEIIHAAGHLAMIHCHGRVRDVLGHMLATGVDAIEPIEPPPQGNITLAELLERADGHLSFLGHIQDQEFHTAPAGTMTRRVEAIAKVLGGRTGYVMAPTCTPFQHPATSTFLRNYTEWLEAASRILGT